MRTPLAVVTGAASGIGLALSHELAARGVDVIAVDKDAMPFDSCPGISAVRLDVSDAEAMRQLAAGHIDRPLDYLFANAGIAAPGGVFGAAGQDWQRAWNVNTMGPLHTLRSWWPSLVLARGKAVVTVSVAAVLIYPGAAIYRATKAALLSMLESLYYEQQGSGVSLHALCPGMVRSNIIQNGLPPGAAVPTDRLTAYLLEAMRTAEPAEDFARRVLDGLEQDPPFYWFTHDKTSAAIDASQRALLQSGRPPMEFGNMP